MLILGIMVLIITFSTHIISAIGGVEPPLVIEKEKLINKKRTKHQFLALSLTKYRNSSKSPLFSFQCFWKYVNYTAELCGMEIKPSEMRSYSGECTTVTRLEWLQEGVRENTDIPPHNSQQMHRDYRQAVGTWQKSARSPLCFLSGHEREAGINIANKLLYISARAITLIKISSIKN